MLTHTCAMTVTAGSKHNHTVCNFPIHQRGFQAQCTAQCTAANLIIPNLHLFYTIGFCLLCNFYICIVATHCSHRSCTLQLHFFCKFLQCNGFDFAAVFIGRMMTCHADKIRFCRAPHMLRRFGKPSATTGMIHRLNQRTVIIQHLTAGLRNCLYNFVVPKFITAAPAFLLCIIINPGLTGFRAGCNMCIRMQSSYLLIRVQHPIDRKCARSYRLCL